MSKEQKQENKEEKEDHEVIIRIMGYDIPGSKNILAGLTRIKGIGWTIAKAACTKLNLPLSKKISELTKDELKKIESFFDNPNIPDFLKNRQKDRETGKSSHLYGHTLSIKKEFDIKRLKKIKSYKGVRHIASLPVRGQRTKSHFRQTGRRAVGVAKKKK